MMNKKFIDVRNGEIVERFKLTDIKFMREYKEPEPTAKPESHKEFKL